MSNLSNMGADLSGLDDIMAGDVADMARNYQRLALDVIRPDPAQPRQNIDLVALEELSRSISERGVIQPISVRPDPDNNGGYLINYGERRYRAAEMAGLDTIPAIIQADSAAQDQLLENIQREDLSAADIAAGIERLITENGMKAKDVAATLGKGKDWVSLYRQFGQADELARDLYTCGFVQDVRTIVELERARSGPNGEAVTQLMGNLYANGETVSRRAVKEQLQQIETPPVTPNTTAAPHSEQAEQPREKSDQSDSQPPAATEPKDDGGPTETAPAATPSAKAPDLERGLNSFINESPGATSEPTAPCICVTVEWQSDGEIQYGRLLFEALDDPETAAVYGDDDQRHELPLKQLRFSSITGDS